MFILIQMKMKMKMKMKNKYPDALHQTASFRLSCSAQRSTREMLHSTVLSPTLAFSPTCGNCFKNLNQTTSPHLPKSLFPKFESDPKQSLLLFAAAGQKRRRAFLTHASFIETPVLWAGKLCVYYALLKSGLAGSQSNPFISDMEGIGGGGGDMGFAEWIQNLQGNPDKEASDKRKLVSKWHPTTKGTLRRNYRVPSKTEGRRLLRSIASLLSEDDHFVDAASHKGCQIRRESAHGESVCCNNVRALFDELPTPHLIVEITAFPAGSLSENDYIKAEKLERVLRSGPNI
ncbi:unnamed protein product [Rhodiola kirilowii]